MTFARPSQWVRLMRVNSLIRMIFYALTLPIQPLRFRLITRLPFQSFWFRPLFLVELYMALGLFESWVKKKMIIKRGSLFIDVGAHIGYHTARAAKAVGVDGFVLAVEPDARNLKLLRLNAQQFRNVKVLPCPIGLNGDGALLLADDPVFTRDPTLDPASIRRAPLPWRERIRELGVVEKRKFVSLDSLFRRLPNHPEILLKIDVERAVANVLRGATGFLRERRPTMIVEIRDLDTILEILLELNYKVDHIYSTYYLFSPLEVEKC